MLQRIKGYLVIGLIAAVTYFFLSRHIVFYGRDFTLLEKEELTFEYTFYSIREKDPEDILEIGMLRRAGIGDILVDYGIITEDRRWEIEDYYDYQEESEQY